MSVACLCLPGRLGCLPAEERLLARPGGRTGGRAGGRRLLQPRPLVQGLHTEVLRHAVLLLHGLHTRQLQAPGGRQEGVQAVGRDGDVSGVDVVDDVDEVLVGDVGQDEDSVLQYWTD